MFSKAFALVSLLLLLGTSVALPDSEGDPERSGNTARGCVWADFNKNDCGAKTCPSGMVEVASGKAGRCNPDERYVCKKGLRKLCCPKTLKLKNCKWQGTAPLCSTYCPTGQSSVGRDGWGSGKYCVSGCKFYCCDN